ncbi:MAG: ABC transporter ATP-binding protein [Sulfurovum sp.]|nr:ABC transporter ATP-binding protein [Sulfurovum sp.]
MPLKITNFSNAILYNISFSLPQGHNLILLGSNGVGKTTLAKILSGMIPSDSVDIDGISPSTTFGHSRAKSINYVPPVLEIFDSFISVKAFLTLSCIEPVCNIEEVLNQVGILHLSPKLCHTLSSGESQLVLIASALLHQANYTIFDEPTANLDPQKIQSIFSLLQKSLPSKSKIIITHHLDLAYQLGFDILFLAHGKIAFYGSSADFFEPLHLETLYQGAVIKENHYIRVNL